MTRTDRRLLLGLAALVTALMALPALFGVSSDLLLVTPALVLLLPLFGGRYVGEERLRRLAAAFVARPVRPRAAATPRGRLVPAVPPRGGRLIATALAVRPPPAALVVP